MSSLYQSMVAVIEQSITRWPRSSVSKVRDCHPRRLYRRAAVYDHRLVYAGVHLPAVLGGYHNSFARGWLDFSQTYREQLMLPFNLSMGVMTFFISVGIGASTGRQFNLDPVMSGLLAFMAFLLVAAPYADGKVSTQYLSGGASSPR